MICGIIYTPNGSVALQGGGVEGLLKMVHKDMKKTSRREIFFCNVPVGEMMLLESYAVEEIAVCQRGKKRIEGPYRAEKIPT